MNIKILFIIIILLLFSPALAEVNNAESITAAYFEHIKNNPEKLLIFLQTMPKGGDLHYHHGSGGGSMAEHLISYGYNENFCINQETYTAYQDKNCPKENRLDNISSNPTFYNAVINAWSMRNFYPLNESGHDHFFNTFGKMDALASAHDAEILAETAERAGEQNESYLELMLIPDRNASGLLGEKIGWNSHLDILRKQLLSHGLNNIVANMQKSMNTIETKEKNILLCETQQEKIGCHVKIYFLYEVLREQPPAQVFAQLLAAFEIAEKDPRFVGINLVQPEDGYISMRDYHLQMKMIEYLHSVYPNVHIALHAGELNTSLVLPDGLLFHIREAVDIAHAERIGHGVDIASETDADRLLQEMANKHIMVEVNLSSNEAVLNVKDEHHPLPLYLSYHVPIAISTDDEGVIRTTLTLEFQKAILRYHLSYKIVKELVRNSLYYSFMPGKNLWQNETYTKVVDVCNGNTLGSISISAACQDYLDHNLKAKMQWDLENRFVIFENEIKSKTPAPLSP